MKKITLYAAALLAVATMYSQTVSFTNEDDLIASYPTSGTETAVDMNGDNLDDYVRVSGGGVGIDFQNPDGTLHHSFSR